MAGLSRFHFQELAVPFLLILLPVVALSMFVRGEKVPIERLMANLTAHFAEYQNQAEAHYLMGRLQSLAFSEKADSVESLRQRDKNQVPQVTFWSWIQEEGEAPDSSTTLSAKQTELFFSSIENYRQAIALAPNAGLYHFSLGWMAEQAQRFASQLSLARANYRNTTWRRIAIREYRDAYRLSDQKVEQLGPGPVLPVEAGEALIANLQKEIKEPTSDQAFAAKSAREVGAVKAEIEHLNRLPRAITPLIFSTRPSAHLGDLLSPAIVDFDLDGFTEGRTWPWLQPDTAVLVWDPGREGHIVSGRQLFGSVTWWMFWNNGFEPLAALDDNDDGWLKDQELEGIGVWQDRNRNGVCDPGEVTPAREFGIVAIRTRADGKLDGTVAARDAVILRDGRRFTLFDWVPQSVPAPVFISR